MCCELGVDICGFVTEYPLDVPWNLTRKQSGMLLNAVSAPTKSCIVTGSSLEKITTLAEELRPDYVQLHFRETLGDTAELVRMLSPYGIGVIKTIPNSAKDRLEQLGTEIPENCTALLAEAGVSVILVDAREPSNAADTGTVADLSLYHRIKKTSEVPVMLGGGIRADNCRRIIREAQPDIIDVMSGVEQSPGEKSHKLLKELCVSVEGFIPTK